MDSAGQIVWSKHNEVQQANLSRRYVPIVVVGRRWEGNILPCSHPHSNTHSLFHPHKRTPRPPTTTRPPGANCRA